MFHDISGRKSVFGKWVSSEILTNLVTVVFGGHHEASKGCTKPRQDWTRKAPSIGRRRNGGTSDSAGSNCHHANNRNSTSTNALGNGLIHHLGCLFPSGVGLVVVYRGPSKIFCLSSCNQKASNDDKSYGSSGHSLAREQHRGR